MAQYIPPSWSAKKTPYYLRIPGLHIVITAFEWVMYFGFAAVTSSMNIKVMDYILTIPLLALLLFHSTLARHIPSLCIGLMMSLWLEWLLGLPYGFHILCTLGFWIITPKKLLLASRPFIIRLIFCAIAMMVYTLCVNMALKIPNAYISGFISAVIITGLYPSLCFSNPMKLALFHEDEKES